MSDIDLTIGPHHLEFCPEYKYLGYWVNEFLDIGESLQKVFNKANQALGLIIAKSKVIGGFTKLYNVSIYQFSATLHTSGL